MGQPLEREETLHIFSMQYIKTCYLHDHFPSGGSNGVELCARAAKIIIIISKGH